MKTTFAMLSLAVVASFVFVTGCARAPIGVPLPRTSRFEHEWRNYARLQPNKAMAIAGDPSGVYAAGYAYAQTTELEAVQAALDACEARRVDRRIDAQCETYAIGDQP